MTDKPATDPDDASSVSMQKKGSQFPLFKVLTVVAIVMLPAFFLLLPVRQVRVAARRTQCKNNLKQIALALYAYEDTYDALPPAHTVDAEGKPLHSWRTLILPYLDHPGVYEMIDLSKPWDDPANAKAYNTRINEFQCPSKNPFPKMTDTTYLAVVASNGCFRPNDPRRFSEITHKHETLMVVEVSQDLAVHWMSPFDADEQMVLGLASKSNLPHDKGTHAVFVDGTVRLIAKDTPSSELRDWISITGSRQ